MNRKVPAVLPFVCTAVQSMGVVNNFVAKHNYSSIATLKNPEKPTSEQDTLFLMLCSKFQVSLYPILPKSTFSHIWSLHFFNCARKLWVLCPNVSPNFSMKRLASVQTVWNIKRPPTKTPIRVHQHLDSVVLKDMSAAEVKVIWLLDLTAGS